MRPVVSAQKIRVFPRAVTANIAANWGSNHFFCLCADIFARTRAWRVASRRRVTAPRRKKSHQIAKAYVPPVSGIRAHQLRMHAGLPKLRRTYGAGCSLSTENMQAKNIGVRLRFPNILTFSVLSQRQPKGRFHNPLAA